MSTTVTPVRSPQPPQPQRPPYQQPQRPPYQQPQRPQMTPVQAPPVQRPQPQRPSQPSQPAPAPAPSTQRRRPATPADRPPEQPLFTQAPPEPESPTPFPPRTIEQLQALKAGAQDYTLLSDDPRDGRKRLVRISFRPCASWQQVATLCKALQEYRSDKFDTIIIQGNQSETKDVYHYTNGQLVFDRQVRLGSDMLNRYQIDTGNGLDISSVRIVLAEKS